MGGVCARVREMISAGFLIKETWRVPPSFPPFHTPPTPLHPSRDSSFYVCGGGGGSSIRGERAVAKQGSPRELRWRQQQGKSGGAREVAKRDAEPAVYSLANRDELTRRRRWRLPREFLVNLYKARPWSRR